MSKPGFRDPQKPQNEKSHVFRIRLHPQSDDSAERALFTELMSRLNGNGNIRQFLIDTYRKAEKMPEKGKPMPIIDTRKIMDKLDKVLSHLRGLKTTGVVNDVPPVDAEYSDDFLSTLDRILDGGLEAPLSDGLEYYDED